MQGIDLNQPFPQQREWKDVVLVYLDLQAMNTTDPAQLKAIQERKAWIGELKRRGVGRMMTTDPLLVFGMARLALDGSMRAEFLQALQQVHTFTEEANNG